MLTVQDDWIQYEAVPARRVAVRGGAACAQRVPVVRAPSSGRRAVPPVASRADFGRVASRADSTRPSRPAPAARRRMRLTRRGRVVLVVLPGLLALSGALVVLGGTGAAEAAPAAAVQASPATVLRTSPGTAARASSDIATQPTSGTAAITVRAGDSLWAIARRIAPQEEPRVVVAALLHVNGLAGSTIHPGDVLRAPAGR